MKKKILIGLVIFIVLLVVINSITYSNKPKIALINIKGVISKYTDVLKYLSLAEKDTSVKAVVINVDSPGGAVGASQEIYRAIERIRNKKPVIVSMGNVAASGGYYISAPANVIFANPGTITGSIGVIVQHVDLTKIMDKIGLKIENIKSGKNKDILYPNNKLTPQQRKLIKDTVLDVYNQFIDAIVKYRKISKNKLLKIADGRIFSGNQARKLGLVDKIGNLQDAIEEARKLIGKEGKEAIIVPFEKQKTIIERLIGSEIHLNTFLAPTGIYYLMKL
ncbi:MAG TPA: signal peptide peptidase SppA [Hydrogenothermaceae bacterium]|nr:signal peptide peptidase SppA [Hydrogenothermaceae bacterium]